MKRINISSGAPWENTVGYSRAVKIGNTIEVSGTVAVKDGEITGLGDPYQQTKRALEIIQKAIEEAGGTLSDVVRTRVYIVNQDDWQKVGQAHGEAFGEIKPASTMVVVKELITPELLVEVEATAVLTN